MPTPARDDQGRFTAVGMQTEDLEGVVSDGVTLVSDDSPEHIAETLGVTLKKPAPVEAPAAQVEAAPEPVKAPPAPLDTTPAPVESRQKGKETPEKRIAQAHYDLRQAEKREREAQERAAALERRLASLEHAAEFEAEPTAAVSAAAVVAETFPTWDTWSSLEANAGKTYEDYADERGDWRAAKRGLITREEAETLAETKATAKLAEAQEAARQAAEARIAETRHLEFIEGREKAKTAHDDYVTVVEETTPDTHPTNAAMETYLRRAGEWAGELMYYLGKHPTDCQRIAKLADPVEVIEEMALIKATLKGAPPGSSVSVEPVTKAPLPVEPVGAARTSAAVSLEKMDIHEYIRTRNDHMRAMAAR